MAWISDIFSSFTPLQQVVATGFGVSAIGFCTSLWLILPVYIFSLLGSVFVMRTIQKRTTCFDSEFFIPLMDFVEVKYKNVKRQIFQYLVSHPNTPQSNTTANDNDDHLHGHGTIYEEEQILLQYVVRDFIKSWYEIISVHNQTPNELEAILLDITSKIFSKLSKVERNKLIGKVIYLYQGHLSSFQDAVYTFEHQPKYRKKKVQDGTEIRKIKDVESAFELKTDLHVAVKDPQNECDYLNAVMMILMKILVPDKAYTCNGGRELLVGILSQNILQNIVDMISDTYWLHVTAIKLLSDDELLLEHPRTSLQHPQTSEMEFHEVIDEEIHAPNKNESQNVPSQSNPVKCKSAQTTTCDSKNTTSAQGDCLDSQSQIIQTGNSQHTSNGEDAYVTDDLSKYFRISPTTACDSSEKLAAQPMNPREMTSKPKLQCYGNIPPSQIPPAHKITPSCSGLQPKQMVKNGLDSSNENITDGDLNIDRPRFRPSFFLANEDTISVDSSASSQGSPFFDPVDSEDDKFSNDRLRPEGNSSREVSPTSFQGVHDAPAQNGILKVATPRESPIQTHSGENAETSSYQSDQNGNTHQTKSKIPELSESFHETGVSIAEDAFKELEGDTHTPPRFLIPDISIPETETAREAGSSGSYTLYIIEFFSWHKQKEGSWVCKKDRVRRRYREFVTLQERLEEHPKYKGKIKDIKGPHKWSFSINGHLDKKSIGKRQKFLEAYLRRLVCKEDVSYSMAVREFLAYEADPRIAFVKKAPERFEQVLVKTMSGVFNKISNVLPSLPDESKARAQGALESHKSEEILNPKEWKDEHDLNLEYAFKEMDNERRGSLPLEDVDGKYSHVQILDKSVDTVMKALIDSVENPVEVATNAANDDDNIEENKDEMKDEFKDAEDKPLLSLPRRAGDGCEGNVSQIPWEKEIPLVTSLFDLAVQSANGKELWVCEVEVLKFLKIILGRALESWFKNEVTELTTEERCAFYLYQLRDTLWPNGELLAASETEPSDAQKAITKQQAKECIMNFLPGVVPIAVGSENFEECVDNILDSIEHTKLNRHFAFRLLDLILETVVPEINIQELQNELLTKETSGG